MWKADPVPDDWEWFWAGEGGRDRLLRDEIEGLQGAASVARSQSARLSSQLAQVQGSMERRLSALAGPEPLPVIRHRVSLPHRRGQPSQS